MKRSWAGEVRNVSLLVASAVNSEGFREILGICEGAKEDSRLVGVSAAPGRSRPQGRAADHFRCLPRPDGERRGVSAGRAMAALHGPFLPERLQPRAGDQGSRGEPYAQGYSLRTLRQFKVMNVT